MPDLDHLRTMTTREFGELTKFAPITVHRMIKRGDIPVVRAGPGNLRIRVVDVEAWMDRCTSGGSKAGEGSDADR